MIIIIIVIIIFIFIFYFTLSQKVMEQRPMNHWKNVATFL